MSCAAVVYAASDDIQVLRPEYDNDEGFFCMRRDGVLSLFRFPGLVTNSLDARPDFAAYMQKIVAVTHQHLPELPCDPMKNDASSMAECFETASNYMFSRGTEDNRIRLVEKLTDLAECVGESFRKHLDL